MKDEWYDRKLVVKDIGDTGFSLVFMQDNHSLYDVCVGLVVSENCSIDLCFKNQNFLDYSSPERIKCVILDLIEKNLKFSKNSEVKFDEIDN